jgi:hypothetical protein
LGWLTGLCWPWNRGKNGERIYKSRAVGPVGSKRAGGPRNGNDSLQGSLLFFFFFFFFFF